MSHSSTYPPTAQRTPPSLATLPFELLNQISRYVVWHDESSGLIAPIPYRNRAHTHRKRSIAMMGPRNRNANPDEYIRTVYAPKCKKAHASAASKIREVLARYPDNVYDHVCDMDCLLQPALSRTSRAMRASALPLFYSTNCFHFELANFRMSDAKNIFSDVIGPVQWWRAIGTDNLRWVQHMKIAGRSMQTMQDDHPGNEIEYSVLFDLASMRKKRLYLTLIEGELLHPNMDLTTKFQERDRKVTTGRWSKLPEINKSSNLKRVLERGGLTVAVLEGLVAQLEGRDSRVLRRDGEGGDGLLATISAWEKAKDRVRCAMKETKRR